MNTKIRSLVLVIPLFAYLAFAIPASAHVVVKPAQVGIGSFQTFTMGIPNEKDNPTVAVRLVIPDGLKYVSPNVKPGWAVDIKKEGTGEDAKVTEIDWTGGNIPVGQRDDFYFSAQVPSNEATLKWDAYQVYQSGEEVAWTQEPGKGDEEGTPHSMTKVINDLTDVKTPSSANPMDGTSRLPLPFSIAALSLSAVAVGMSLRNKK